MNIVQSFIAFASANPMKAVQIAVAVVVIAIFLIMHFVLKTAKGLLSFILFGLMVLYGFSGLAATYTDGMTKTFIMNFAITIIGIFGFLKTIKHIV